MQQSLLNYFNKGAKPTNTKQALGNKNQESSFDLSDEDVPTPKRRRRLVLDSSDEENIPQSESNVASPAPASSPLVKLTDYSCSASGMGSSKRSKSISTSTTKTCSPTVSSALLSTDLPFASENLVWEHLTLPFLLPDKIRDSSHRRPDHPDYDKTTLHVPCEFLAKQTPGMRQWWELKSRYADVVIFFKMGKFYELYHMDAVIGVEQLGLIFMKGAYAHCGFPEVAFSRNADILVKKGYKVCRVEQTESVDAMSERTRGARGSDKVVRREVCQLLTPGTCTADMRSDISSYHQYSESVTPMEHTESSESSLLAIGATGRVDDFTFGVAILDATNGNIQIGQFSDDRHCSKLRTFIAQHSPSQVLVERGYASPALKNILSTILSTVPVEHLAREKQFWSANRTITELETANYFNEARPYSSKKTSFPGKENWPSAILSTLSEDDPLGRSVKREHELAISCLGAIVFYLRYCLIDQEIMSLGYVEYYEPADSTQLGVPTANDHEFYRKQNSVILDSITLANLDILYNNSTGTREGTLIERLDTCCTPFGRRLMRRWITAPLCNPESIRQRQDAVEVLMANYDRLTTTKDYLRRLPDFERLLTKIHLIGSRRRDPNHPDCRAVIYEEVQYSRKNIIDFVATLNGFELVYEMIAHLKCLDFGSTYLASLVLPVEDGGQFPQLSPRLSFFKNAFDAEKAKRDGRILPERGVDAMYDATLTEIQEISDELDAHLLQSGKRLGTRLVYWGTGRNRFQIEVPEASSSRVPSNWQLSSQRKGFKRYRSPESQDLLNRMMAAEEKKDASLRQIMQNLFASFSEDFAQWQDALRAIAELDCLIALATYSTKASDVMCRPEFIDLKNAQIEPFLEIVDGLHPCLINTFSCGNLIPNDVRLGRGEFARAVLVTGPNMGGKSTLMRQTALLVILAHLGCWIPAQSCRLTPVDRIFSRLGASDRLLAGESTFMVELSETAAILRHITPHSLVLMDELGRGTSTHDGAALASAVLRFLSEPKPGVPGPRTLFSTHYHSLVDEVSASNKSSQHRVSLGHMACMLEENSNSETGLEHITFLYKFIKGACPKSYGFNAARLAHLPDKVIQQGLAKAKEFEKTLVTFACLRRILLASIDLEESREWLRKLQSF